MNFDNNKENLYIYNCQKCLGRAKIKARSLIKLKLKIELCLEFILAIAHSECRRAEVVNFNHRLKDRSSYRKGSKDNLTR